MLEGGAYEDLWGKVVGQLCSGEWGLGFHKFVGEVGAPYAQKYIHMHIHTLHILYICYTHLEFRRRAQRDKKAFLSDQYKEREENSRMGKTRDPFKKIRDIKRTFHAKMGTKKDKKSMDLIEAEDIKKRWQKYTEELYKKRS